MTSVDFPDWTQTVQLVTTGTSPSTPYVAGGAPVANTSTYDVSDSTGAFLGAAYHIGANTTATALQILSISSTLMVWGWSSTTAFQLTYTIRNQANSTNLFEIGLMVPSGTTTGQPPFANLSVTFPGGLNAVVSDSTQGPLRAIFLAAHGPTSSVNFTTGTVVTYNDPTL